MAWVYPFKNESREQRLHSLLRWHRQRVFDDNGDSHGRAIDRLKRTETFKAHCESVRQAALQRRSDRLLSAYA
jgi:hypothetical protein